MMLRPPPRRRGIPPRSRVERHPSLHVHPLLRHLGSFVLAAALAATLAPARAEAAMMVAPAGTRPKDFSFVKKDGVYHLFYIRHNDFLPPWATEIDFGHATSTDLYHWTNHAPVLGLDPSGWDNLHVWAPHVVQWDGLYWMFYTGITDRPGFRDTQRIGAAVSSDLFTWNRVLQAPVWATQASSWAWWQPLSTRPACRDPFVMPDPSAPGQWLMYYTSNAASDTLSDVVGVARSTGDPAIWQDEKALWITHKSWSFNVSTESPHLFEHDGRWFLVITSNAGQPLSFFVTSDPLGEPQEWQYRGRLRNMIGEDTSQWFASEVLQDGEQDLFAFANGNHIEIRRIQWAVGDTFDLVSPSLFHMVDMEWTHATARENQFIGLTLEGTNGFAFEGPLAAWVKDASGAEIPAPIDSLGLPAMPEFSSDSLQVAWFARRWPASLPASQPMDLRIGMADGTASTGWLRVVANAIEQQPFEDRGGRSPAMAPNEFPDSLPHEPVPDDSLLDVPSSGPDHPLGLRVLQNSPLGGGPVVVFDLPEPATVRLEIFDVLGRRLATLADRDFPRGANVVPWDRRDAGGGRAGHGLYFVRMSTPIGVAGAKFFLNY